MGEGVTVVRICDWCEPPAQPVRYRVTSQNVDEEGTAGVDDMNEHVRTVHPDHWPSEDD